MISTPYSAAISTIELGQLYRSGESGNVNILDVRTPVEYQEKHIEGSTLAPLDSLNEKSIAELNKDNSEPIYIVCHSGNRAKNCIDKMHHSGFDNAVLVKGGIQAWEKENLPLNRGKETISLERQVRIAAGTFIFTGSLLAWFIHPAWLALPAMMGAGLLFAGITNSCGLGLLLARMPWNK